MQSFFLWRHFLWIHLTIKLYYLEKHKLKIIQISSIVSLTITVLRMDCIQLLRKNQGHSSGFSTLALLTFEVEYFFVGNKKRGCDGHCVIFSSITGLYQLDAKSIHQLRKSNMSGDISKWLMGVKIVPQ